METTRKKIAIVSDAVYPFNKGGKEKRIYDITTRLAEQGYDVTIYCMRWWEGEKAIVRDGVTLHAISPYYPLYAGKRRSIHEATFFALHCFKMLGEKFDVVEIDHMPHLVLFSMKIVCMLKRKRMVVVWHEVWGKDYWKQYLGPWLGMIAFAVEKMSVKLPDTIVSISPHTTKSLRNILGAKKEIVTIANGVDSEAIQNISPAKQKSDVIFVGRLLSHKNVDFLVRALGVLKKNDPNISAIIIGGGPEEENLRKLSRELGLQKNISFLGPNVTHEETYAIMQASRVFVLPSTREGFGLAAIEANACGLPVVTIAHDQNATTDLIVDGKNGVLAALDEHQIAQAIEQLLKKKNNPSMYRTYAEKYNWKRIVQELQRVYAL
jgi:glycosyltransferase involved in cell wall biosynthesis